jgi:hypothetical protein
MRAAFVVQLGPETKPGEGRFEGLVEEVDSGRELRFHSAEELMSFLGQRFDLAGPSADQTRPGNKMGQVPSKKNPHKAGSSSRK